MKLAQILTMVSALAAILLLGACQQGGETEVAAGPKPVFGDGSTDNSRVIARVNGEPITEKMLDMRYEELNKQEKARFQGPEGRRVFLRQMIDEMIRVREAEARKLQLDPTVARVLISERRQTMDLALRVDLVEGREPSIDDVREYFEAHRDQYRRLGTMHASHIALASREEAQQAYEDIVERNRAFGRVAHEMSINEDTKLNGGDLGWFNKGGFIPFIRDSKGFTELVWDLDQGVNPPVEYQGTWHVVQIHDRKYERAQTLEEAYDRVVADMQDEFQTTIIDAWMRQAKAGTEVEYFAEFRPGHGKTAKELMERAFYAGDPQEKLDLLGLLVDDYPEDEYADDALFMAGNISLDSWGDRRQASVFLHELVKRYPESPLVEDAQYMLDHMHEPGMVHPKSIEELRKLGESD
jgi:peptidyl-prolyl cis-trans isomerase C